MKTHDNKIGFFTDKYVLQKMLPIYEAFGLKLIYNEEKNTLMITSEMKHNKKEDDVTFVDSDLSHSVSKHIETKMNNVYASYGIEKHI
jgi:hypothetical protein